MQRRQLTRRRFMATSAAASATTVAAPFVHTAGAAGSLSMGLWDHWVPGANKAMTEICEAWAQKEKVEIKIDYLSTQGNKLYLTIAAEALAKSGHDIMDFSAWEPNQYENSLEPVDDVMKEVLAATARSARSTSTWPSPRASGWRCPASAARCSSPLQPFRPDEGARRHRHPRHVSRQARSRPRRRMPGPGMPS